MRTLVFGMNASVDGDVAAPGHDLGWSAPSDELSGWWLEQERASGLSPCGRRLLPAR